MSRRGACSLFDDEDEEDDLFLESPAKVKLHSDSFEETYHVVNRMNSSSRLGRLRSENKKSTEHRSSSAWKTWNIKPRTYSSSSRKKEDEKSEDTFDSLLSGFASGSRLGASISNAEEEDKENIAAPNFSPDDGALFSSPGQTGAPLPDFSSPHLKKTRLAKRAFIHSPKSNSKADRKGPSKGRFVVVSSPIHQTPGHAPLPKSKVAKRPLISPCVNNKGVIRESPLTRRIGLSPRFTSSRPIVKDSIVLLHPLTKSILEAYSAEEEDMKIQPLACSCSSCKEEDENVLECDYCPARVHAICHGVSVEELEDILEKGLLWACPSCSEKKREEEGEEKDGRKAATKVGFVLEDNKMIQAKGGKKWRRTMASNLLQSAADNRNISIDEDCSLMKKFSEVSLMDQNDSSATLGEDQEEEKECFEKEEEEDDDEALDPSSPLVDILFCCRQNEILTFEDLYERDVFEKSKKVGEGTFGEVYLLNGLDSESEYPPVLKVIPVDGSIAVNDEPQTTLEEVLAEIQISLSLSSLVEQDLTANFVEVNMVHIVAGGYPDVLLGLWDAYHEEKESLNIRPDYLGMEQKYIAFEFSNGGTDLETTVLFNAAQGLAVFNQVAHSLAVAEERLSFEHRDLHWGNILIQGTEEESFTYHFDEDTSYVVLSSGVKATIIDFSLSRLSIHDLDVDIFKDLSEDETLFNAVGDYQFEIYRLMKDSNANDWKAFNPFSNVLWLHYLLDKLVSSVPYKSVKSRAHRSAMASLRRNKKNMLGFLSAKHFVLSNGLYEKQEC